jgi:FRG domain protein
MGESPAKNISELLERIKALGEPGKGYTRFFRGQADESWKMLPSIYRKGYLIKNEHKIIKDALTNCPNDFLPSDTWFEKLVKLQHYGYATRLLDLTENVLVALYFAVEDKRRSKKNGALIVLDIPNDDVKYGDSDTVAILSALSLQKEDFSISKKYLTMSKDELKNTIEPFNEDQKIISLIHDIRADKPSFRQVINPGDLGRVLCVRAKLNNARIFRQQGCFLLFGIEGRKRKPAHIPDEWQCKKADSDEKVKIIIKNEFKEEIQKELRSFSISKRNLFPELEKQAEEIMSQYKPNKSESKSQTTSESSQ